MAGTVCCVSEVHAGPVPGGRPLERIPGGDERAVRRRQEGDARRRAGLSGAVRTRHDLSPPDEPLRAARQLRPAELPRDPRADPQDDRLARGEIVLWGDGTPTREYLYVDDCVEGLLLAAERYDGREPVNLGTGVETSIRETAEIVAEAVGFRARSNGTPRCRTASRGARSMRPGPRTSSASVRASRCARESHDRRLVRAQRRHDTCRGATRIGPPAGPGASLRWLS